MHILALAGLYVPEHLQDRPKNPIPFHAPLLAPVPHEVLHRLAHPPQVSLHPLAQNGPLFVGDLVGKLRPREPRDALCDTRVRPDGLFEPRELGRVPELVCDAAVGPAHAAVRRAHRGELAAREAGILRVRCCRALDGEVEGCAACGRERRAKDERGEIGRVSQDAYAEGEEDEGDEGREEVVRDEESVNGGHVMACPLGVSAN